MKNRLLAPGPTPVPDRVLKEMNKNIIHHRTPQFEKLFAECQEGLAWLLQTSESPLILGCSGTGAFEASLQSFFSAKDKVLCVGGGKFADNWFKMSQCFGLEAIEIPVMWGKAADPDSISLMLKKHPDCKGVIMVASETSTGVRHPYEEIAQIVKNYPECLLVLDAVTALGVWELSPEKLGVDIVVAGSQKGLMLPPGLGFVWASDKAWERQKTSSLPKFYFDLGKEKAAQKKCQTAHTPAVSLIMGLHECLNMMKEEGLTNIWQRHQRLGEACRAAMKALGLKLLAERPSDAITSVYSPPELKPDGVYLGLRDLANFTIAGGQDQLAGKIFRIGHMGYVDDIDLLGAFGALEIVLKKLGYEKFSPGDSLLAASPILQKGFLIS